MAEMILWLIVGAIAGALAETVIRGHGHGLLVDIGLGLLGAVIGGWLLSVLGVSLVAAGIPGLFATMLTAFLGAVILIALIRALPGPMAV